MCNRIEHLVHLIYAGIRQAQYTDTWTCHLHRESRLTGLANPKPNPLIHSPPSTTMPSRSKKIIHISHTPPTPPNSELINHPSSNHIFTKLTPNHIHHHYAPSVTHIHNIHHLFNCTHIRTTLSPLYLWTDPTGVTALLNILDEDAGWWTTSWNIVLPPTRKGHVSG